MISKQQKQKIVDGLVELFQGAGGLYFVDFTGMSVAETQEFRATLREKDIKFKVAKNTLIKRALAEVEDLEIPDDVFHGQTGIIFGYEDSVAPAKVIKKAHDDKGRPQLKSAWLEGRMYEGTRLEELSKLPTREDILAGIVGSLSAPAQGIVGSMAAVMRDIAHMVEEVAKKNSEAA
ncbi:MAG: 50S ribosomal protein L10 [Bacteroidota bacterium]